MKSYEVPSCYCPQCREPLEMASTLSDPDARPRPGMFSVCIRCGQISKFGHDLRLVLPTRAEVKAVMEHVPEALMVRKFIMDTQGKSRLFKQLVCDEGDLEIIGVRFEKRGP